MNDILKRCPDCRQDKPLSEYGKDSHRSGGLYCYCKECATARTRKRRAIKKSNTVEYRINVLSLGWGVQSFCLAAMSALGAIPPIHAAVHADTAHERSETYAFAARWTPWLEEHGVRVITVRGTSTDVIENPSDPRIMIPAHIMGIDGKGSGLLRRQCTLAWKIMPVRRWIQSNRNKQRANLLLGITTDEWKGMRDSSVKYIIHQYPFIDLNWNRTMATQWLLDNNLEVPVKSACVFCPYSNNKTWQDLKQANSHDWTKAVEVDKTIRNKRRGYTAYLHRNLKPLGYEEQGDDYNVDEDECSGMCFL